MDWVFTLRLVGGRDGLLFLFFISLGLKPNENRSVFSLDCSLDCEIFSLPDFGSVDDDNDKSTVFK